MSKRRGNGESSDLSEGHEVQSKVPHTDISTDDEWHSSQNTESWESLSSETVPDEDHSFSDQSVLTENNDQISESVAESSGHFGRISDCEPPDVPVIPLSPTQDNPGDSNVAESSGIDSDDNETVEDSVNTIGLTDENNDDTSDTGSVLSLGDLASDAESLDNESVDNRRVNYVGANVDLYDGAPVTVEESLISILNFALRHKTTKAQLSDTLKLIELHCPPQNHCKNTIYSFEKFFSDIQTPLIRHHFCSGCLRNIESADSVCERCNEESTIKYFIEVPIIDQLRTLYKRPGFRDMLQYRFTRVHQNHGNYEDIFDGAVYKDLSHEGGFLANRDNISMMWYADGFRVYKSSNFSIWAVYLQINELPLSERTKKENVILAALWFGDEKPVPNLLLAPVRDSLKILRRGIDVQIPELQHSIHIKGIVICGTCDLPAKALFLNMTQYNGKFGCQKCKQRGEYLREDRVFVYPFEPFTLRTDEETRVHAREAWQKDTPVCGVKGPTILSKLVHENIRAVAVDVMHCLFEGVAKSLMKFWFSPQFSEHPASLIDSIDLVDQRISSLTPPSSVQRLPRSIRKHLSYWKAHEFKTWFFYYSIPCINDIMLLSYFNHYKLLVLGISLLCQSSISPNDLDVASRALIEFVSMFEHLYYRKSMSNNVHQLLHLPETVRQFGPLWTTTCFPFEDLNGQLLKLVHGSNAAQLQIHHAVSMYVNLTTLKSKKLIPGRSATRFCDSLDYKRGRMKRHLITDSVYIIGKCTKMDRIPVEINRIFQQQELCGASYFYYKRLLKGKFLYSSMEYRRSARTNSTYVVFYAEDGSTLVGQIRCFVRVTNCFCRELCDCVGKSYAILEPCLLDTPFSTCIDGTVISCIHKIRAYEGQELAVDISKLHSVCFYCKIREENTFKEYVIEPVNLVESELNGEKSFTETKAEKEIDGHVGPQAHCEHTSVKMAFALIFWLKSCTTSVVDTHSIPISSTRSIEENAVELVPLGAEYYQAKILKLDDDYDFLEAVEVTATGRIVQEPSYASKNTHSDCGDEENKNKNKRKLDEIRCHTERKKKQRKDLMRGLDKELLSDNDDSDLNVQISISPEKSSVIPNERNSPEKSREIEEIHRQDRTEIKKNNDAMQKRGDDCLSRNEDHVEDYNPNSQVSVSQGSLSNISIKEKCLIVSQKKIDDGNHLELIKPFNRKANKKIFSVETEEGSRKVEELQRNSSVYVNYDELKLIKTECATNPNEMIRRLLKIIIGVNELKNMTALGKKTSYAKGGRFERKAIPMHILNAVKDFTDRKSTPVLTKASYHKVINKFCGNLRNPKQPKSDA